MERFGTVLTIPTMRLSHIVRDGFARTIPVLKHISGTMVSGILALSQSVAELAGG